MASPSGVIQQLRGNGNQPLLAYVRRTDSLVCGAIVTELQTQSRPHNQQGKPPGNDRVDVLPPLKVSKHPPDEQVEVDTLAELPEEGGQEEVMEEGCPCRAQLVWTGDCGPVDAHQEH